MCLFHILDGEQEGLGVTSPTNSVPPPDVTSPTSSLTSGMMSPLDKTSSGMTTPLSNRTVTSPGNVTSPTQKASSGVTSPGYSSGLTSPTYRHSAEGTSPGAKDRGGGSGVTSPQRHSAEIMTFGTCYGPPRKSPSVTSPTTSSTPGVTSPVQKVQPAPAIGAAAVSSSGGGVTSPTQRYQQQGVLSPTQAAIQVCFM